ncbi:MAG: mannose-1-phosphate guanylyltransferase/mannose-6-phosphate isomerase [Archaeoglobus sp.]|nr:mannose-1-phosphate guanylyltransferase/mannose-6-phosphate isomerase [Archaeoglobus sp.]
MSTYTLILAGGKGTRLWPLSREDYPKQFYNIFNRSLFQKTVERALLFSKPDEILVVTNERYKFRVLDDLEEMGVEVPKENILMEPAARNTLPAIYFGVKSIIDNGSNPGDSVAVLPSDHYIEPDEAYRKAFENANRISKRFLVTFGIQPSKPHTGYGYIKPGERIDSEAFKVEKFVEKPELEKAKEYVTSGYLWNSGMFMFGLDLFVEECKLHQPDVVDAFKLPIKEAYSVLPEVSVDYGIMEKTDKAAVVKLNSFWSDVGSFDSLYEIFEKDEAGNAIRGECVALEAKNNLVYGGRLTAIIGVEDLVVVDTKDAVLVCKKNDSQRVKEVVEILKQKNDKRAEVHRTAYRPWGSYTVLEENQFYKIKRLTVKPKKRLSLQKHYHRSEHWVVVKGTAKVTVDGEEKLLRNGESTFIPAGAIHRLENPGRIPLEVIEVQIGEYLDENDIERFEDDFERV